MNGLDAFLVIVAVFSALSGFRHGFVVAACSLIGFLGGAWVGLQIAPLILGSAPRVFTTAMLALLLVLAVAYGGQLLGAFAGRRLRTVVVPPPGRIVDAAAGAATAVVYVLVFSWAVGVAIASSGLPAVTGPVRGSAILHAVDRVLPDGTSGLFSRFTGLLDRTGFPTVFAPFSRESIQPVDPPERSESVTDAVVDAAPSVVKVAGIACGSGVTGSGFVYAPGIVVTNAHVVAGVPAALVQSQEGSFSAVVIGFDPQVDVAVLSVPGLRARALPFGGAGHPDDPVAVLAYPGGGDFEIVPGRIRTQRSIIGPDIYDEGRVVREVFAVRAPVRPGDSGGPLVGPDGAVVGVVFAASIEDDQTGYALTADQARPSIEAAIRADRPVSTQACA